MKRWSAVRLGTLTGIVWFTLQSAHSGIVGTFSAELRSTSTRETIEVRCETSALCELEVSQGENDATRRANELQRSPLEPLGGCKSPPKSEWDECDINAWHRVREALRFALENQRNLPDTPSTQLLKPLLESHVDVTSCFNMHVGLPGEAVVLCELESSPWGKPAILYFVQMLTPGDPRTGLRDYNVLPLFRTGETAKLRAQRTAFVAASPQVPPSSQKQVADYIADLEARVRAALVVPPGTPPSARVAYQIQFNQETGRIYSVNFGAGCYCQTFRSAVAAAVRGIQPLPVLPKDQHSILGGRNAAAYLETTAPPPHAH